MIKLALITEDYPFNFGEQFLETEIKQWSKNPKFKVTIFPQRVIGKPRPIPDNINIDTNLAATLQHKKTERIMRFAAPFSKTFWKELSYLNSSKNISLNKILRALRTTASFAVRKKALIKSLNISNTDVIYFYWNSPIAYAATEIVKQTKSPTIVSRLHSIDLYEMRQKYQYMPLKRQFLGRFNHLFCISDQGKEYLLNTYQPTSGNVSVSRLGVNIPRNLGVTPKSTIYTLLSLSSLVEVKRIDKLIKGLACLSDSKHIFRWLHIGGGPLETTLSELAEKELSHHANITFEFLGQMPNKEVKKFIGKTPVDLFLNTSDYEGLPVSIMEAMSFGIPCIAPDVGGIQEILTEDCHLLDAQFSPKTLGYAIEKLTATCRHSVVRQTCRERIEVNYNESTNYQLFIDQIEEIAK